MRVLFVLGAGVRAGAERILLTLARHLPAVGVEPVVAALADGPFLDELQSHGIEVVRLHDAPRARQVWRTREVVRRLTEAITAAEVEIVQPVGEKMAIFAGRAARRAGAASVVWLHDAPARDARATAVQTLMATSPRDALVAPSEWMARAFRRRLGLRARVIPHGISADELPARAADLRGEMGWRGDAVVVGHFARLQRWKGGEEFLTAAADVAHRNPDARFVVVGGSLYGLEPGYAERLPRLAEALGLGGRVRFLGHRDDALALMAACDVVVHCSNRPEPFGMVVLEAMAMGRAVVASRGGAPPEIVDDGRTGLLVGPGRPLDLADAINRLVRDPRMRAEFGAASVEMTRREWTAARMAERFAALYDQVAPVRASQGR